MQLLSGRLIIEFWQFPSPRQLSGLLLETNDKFLTFSCTVVSPCCMAGGAFPELAIPGCTSCKEGHSPGSSATVAQQVSICPKTSYSFQFMARRWGYDGEGSGTGTASCQFTYQFGLGDSGHYGVVSNLPANEQSTYATYGPFSVAPFNVGDGGTQLDSDMLTLAVDFVSTMTCYNSGDGHADWHVTNFVVTPQT